MSLLDEFGSDVYAHEEGCSHAEDGSGDAADGDSDGLGVFDLGESGADDQASPVAVGSFGVTRKDRRRIKRVKAGSTSVHFRRRFPLMGYIGENGSGKSYTAVRDTYPSLVRGRLVLSTVPLYDVTTGLLHPCYQPLTSWRDVVHAEHCDLLLDEAQGVISSRASMTMPPQLASVLMQLRRRDVAVRWTTPDWSRVDLIMRQVTPAVVLCRSFIPKILTTEAWAPRRWIVARTLNASGLDGALTLTPQGTAPQEVHTLDIERRWVRPTACPPYDSLGSAQVMDHLSDTGWCETCGGTRMRQKCSCAPDLKHSR